MLLRKGSARDAIDRSAWRKRGWLHAPAWLLPLLLSACTPAPTLPFTLSRLDGGDARASAAEIVAGNFGADFQDTADTVVTPSREHGDWYRLTLAEDWSKRSLLLRIADPQGLDVAVYAPPAYTPVVGSIYDRDANNGFARHALAFVIARPLHAGVPIYLHVGPAHANPRRVTIGDVAAARVAELWTSRVDVLLPTLLVSMMLVMLCFFAILRERMYGYFAAHVFFLAVFEVYASGLGYELWPLDLFAPLRMRPMWAAAALAALLLLVFSRAFIDTLRLVPQLDRVIAALRWPLGAVVICAAIPAFSSGWWLGDALCVVLLIALPLLLLAAVLAWQHGSRRAGFYLCGWIPGLLLAIAAALQALLNWEAPPWLETGFSFAFVFANLVLSFGLADHTLSMRHERDFAHRLAERDALTGVMNRRAILARLRTAFVQARISGAPLSVLFLDLDHFKRINDSHGHRAGDQCLRAAIGPIASELRQHDAVGRYGGEEFLVVLSGTGAANAEVVAERIRRRTQEMSVLVSGLQIGLTVSIGVAALDARMRIPEDLVESADAALYRAKSAGRNRVVLHGGPDSDTGAGVPVRES